MVEYHVCQSFCRMEVRKGTGCTSGGRCILGYFGSSNFRAAEECHSTNFRAVLRTKHIHVLNGSSRRKKAHHFTFQNAGTSIARCALILDCSSHAKATHRFVVKGKSKTHQYLYMSSFLMTHHTRKLRITLWPKKERARHIRTRCVTYRCDQSILKANIR